MKQTLHPLSVHRLHQISLAGLALGMMLTIGLAYEAPLRAQLTETGAAMPGLGLPPGMQPPPVEAVPETGEPVAPPTEASVPIVDYSWTPTEPQRKAAELAIAGVHDEIRSYTRAPDRLAEAHGSAPESINFFRRILNEIVRWFGITE